MKMTGQLTPCLSDEQWDRVRAIFERVPKTETRGRPGYENRAVFERVLWVILHDIPWGQLPACAPDYRTCHRRYLGWSRSGLLAEALTELFGPSAEDLMRSLSRRSRNRKSDGSDSEAHKKRKRYAVPTPSVTV
jgi:transposase